MRKTAMPKKGYIGQRRLPIYCVATYGNVMGVDMPDEIDGGRGLRIAEWSFGGWRVVASAWLVAIVFVVLFAGVQALASLHGTSPHQAMLAGAVIPRHDPSCAGAVELTKPSPPSCGIDLQNGIERAEASYYGW
jgi:hypothetical protein